MNKTQNAVADKVMPFKVTEAMLTEAGKLIVQTKILPERIAINGNIIQLMMRFGADELATEEHFLAEDGEKALAAFGQVKFNPIYESDKYLHGTAQMPKDIYDGIERRLYYLYPDSQNMDEETKNSYLAQMGFVWLKRIEEGQVVATPNN